MKNILLLGLSDSLFTRDFCREVLKADDTSVSILSPRPSPQYGEFYRDSGISELVWPEFFSKGILGNIGLHMAGRYMSAIRDLERKIGFDRRADAVFVHYVEPLHILYFHRLWKKARKRILVFWGYDIMCASDKKLKLFPHFLKQSTAIVFMIPNQREYFQSKFGHRYDRKLHVIDFGNSVLDQIDKAADKYTVRQCKEEMGLPVDKILVHVGYNALRGQRHIDMAKSLVSWSQLPGSEQWTDRLQFVFHVSYGRWEEYEDYRKQLCAVMDSGSLAYVFVEDYYQDERLAMFRRTCDIFLYGQKTDARSASPLEYVYAGARFLCPVWLKDNYRLLDEGGCSYYVYEDFADLTNVFNRCLVEYSNADDRAASSKVREVIREAVSWESLAPKWRSLYE